MANTNAGMRGEPMDGLKFTPLRPKYLRSPMYPLAPSLKASE